MQHIGTQEIETPRLHLRRFTVEDAPAMFRNWASDPEVTRYLTWQPHPSVTDTEATLARWAADYEKPDTYRWCMEWKATGEVIGSIDVVDGNDNVRRAEIGYCMSRRFWGQGIMTEALIAVEDYLFSKARKVLLIIRMVRQSMFILYQYINIMKLVGFCLLLFIQISYQVFCRLQLIIMLAMHLFLMKMVMLF